MGGGLSPSRDLQFLEKVMDVVLDCRLGNVELLCDLLVGVALSNEVKNLSLAACQRPRQSRPRNRPIGPLGDAPKEPGGNSWRADEFVTSDALDGRDEVIQ